jgi:hypothetical protein
VAKGMKKEMIETQAEVKRLGKVDRIAAIEKMRHLKKLDTDFKQHM